MQRTGGKADGSDLKARGLKARGQGIGSKRLSVDDQYDEKEAAGELRSTTFQMPWTKAATSKIKAGAPDVSERMVYGNMSLPFFILLLM